MGKRRQFGKVRKLPSGRYQASYIGPDTARHTAPATYRTEMDADRWLLARYDEIAAGTWSPAPAAKAVKAKPLTFAEYAEQWMARVEMAPLSRKQRRGLLANQILPTFGARPLRAVTRDEVREWYYKLNPKHPGARRNAYVLLHTIYEAAVDEDELVAVNPVRVKGGAAYSVQRAIEPATVEELDALVAALPHRHRLLALLGAWCALRFGEVTGLTRADIDLTKGIVKVRRGVVHPGGEAHVGKTKTPASVRDVSIPPHVIPAVRDHLNTYVTGRDGLLFPNRTGGYLTAASFYGTKPYVDRSGKHRPGSGFYAARVAAGRPDLRFHDLRHTGATMAARNGATLRELMHRLGHRSERVALAYQHASAERDRALAARMSEQVTASESPSSKGA